MRRKWNGGEVQSAVINKKKQCDILISVKNWEMLFLNTTPPLRLWMHFSLFLFVERATLMD